MPSWLVPVVWMLALIALYLLLVHSGGAAQILGSVGEVTKNQTLALQGR